MKSKPLHFKSGDIYIPIHPYQFYMIITDPDTGYVRVFNTIKLDDGITSYVISSGSIYKLDLSDLDDQNGYIASNHYHITIIG